MSNCTITLTAAELRILRRALDAREMRLHRRAYHTQLNGDLDAATTQSSEARAAHDLLTKVNAVAD